LTVKLVDDMLGLMPNAATEPFQPSPEADQVVIPALLRASRGSYGLAIRTSLAEAGCGDVPRNGAFVLGGIVNQGVSASDLVRQLGVSKQATSQLLDTLVVRGYLERRPDPEDRRRVTLEATERGREAAKAVRAAVVSVDDELTSLLTTEQMSGLRAGLVALCDIRDRREEAERALAS
jgi:DNA-binding MarR family transcriptional regulator